MNRDLKTKLKPLRKPIQDELVELEEDLLKLLAKRSQLLAKARQLYHRSGQTRRDIDLDRHLWQLWDNRTPKDAANIKFYRTLFTLLQELASRGKDTLAERPSRPETGKRPIEQHTKATVTTREPSRSFLLTPRQMPIELNILGPSCMEQTRLLAALAAFAEQPIYMSGVIINDPLIELVKALNQVGGNLRWDVSGLKANGAKGLNFDNKIVFCGNDPFNAYLLLALAKARPTHCKLAGGTGIRMLDLVAFRRVAPHLGGRLGGVAPGTPSMPIRIEASAVPADIVPLPDDLPPLAAMAIAGAAPAYPNGLSLSWSPRSSKVTALKTALSLAVETLKQCKVPYTWGPASLTIGAAVPVLPKEPNLALDPWISTALLALPGLYTPGKPWGKSRLLGLWPQDLATWQEAERLLTAVGLIINIDDTGASTIVSKYNQKESPTGFAYIFDAALYPEALPLAIAMTATRILAGRNPGVVLTGVSKQEHAVSCELLERVGLVLTPISPPVYEAEAWTVTQRETPPLPEEPTSWASPSPLWTIAYALLACRRPGLRLFNPNSITGLVPKFWSLYNSLPNPPHDILFQPRRHQREQQAREYSSQRRIRA